MLTLSLRVTGQPSYIFHHLTTENGLSNSNVKAILKDSYGFLWIGTELGLNRYDGYNFKVYTSNPGNPNSLLTNDILGLQEDGLGNIWINIGFSYSIYLRGKDCFIPDGTNYLAGLGIRVDRNFRVYIDKKQDLWVISAQKAFFYDTHQKKLKVFAAKIKSEDVASINLSDDGERLFGILPSGLLWQIDKSNGNQAFIELPGFIKQEIFNRVNKIYLDSHDGLWIFSNKTDLIYYKKNQGSEWIKLNLNSLIESQSNIVLNITDDENGHIWIGTDHKGIFIYDEANESLTNLHFDKMSNSTVASNNIGCLYKDNNGIIWIGHNKKGISYYHDSFHNFINIEHADCKDVSAIFEDVEGKVWLGTDGNGLFMKGKTPDSKIQKLPMQNNAIVSLINDQKGRVWIGTYLNGLFCYENGTFSHFTKNNSKLATDNIWNLKEDRYGNIWICTLGGGIQCLPATTDKFDSLITTYGEIDNSIDMFYDGGDKLYLGTSYGLYSIDIATRKKVLYLGNNKGTQQFKQMFISSIYKDDNDNIWLGHSLGLTIWDMKKDTLYYFDKQKGLCDDIIRGIVEDNHQNIWVTTSNGLSVLSAKRDGKGNLRITSRNFSTKDGLVDNNFNNHAVCKLRNGDILIGGPEGYTVVNPNKMYEKSQSVSKVIFTGLSVSNSNIQIDSVYNGHKLLEHPMEQTSSLTFSYNDKLLTFQFTTVDLLNADKVRYVYKVEGFNDQWLPTQGNKIEFSSLAPGRYRLFIKASNSDGVWNEESTLLDITVTPPFYLSWYAITIYTLLVCGLIIFIIYRTRKNHRTRLERQRINLESEQKANLIEMKLRFFTNISHDLRTPLTLIITPLQTILSGILEDGLRKKLITINKNAEQLLQLINSLLDFRKLDVGAETLRLQTGDFISFISEACKPFHAYAIDRRINFTFSHEMESISIQFDPDKVNKMLSNLLSNAFKYTQDEGSIEVHIYQSDKHVCVSVSDSGQGINETQKKLIFERFYQASQNQNKTGSGIGLHIVREYVLMHKGIITVEDNLPQGSIFTFKLPVIEIGTIEELITEKEAEDELFEIEESQNVPVSPVLLFVDDNTDFCDFMADSLSDEYTVLVANNGQEAIDLLDRNDINVVVSDVMMPVMSGTELCNRIKTNIHWSHIPVILLTARAAEEYKIEGLEMGADDYITKPFNFNLLKLRIRKFLEWTEKCHLSFSQKMDVTPNEITITPLDEKLIGKAIKVVEEHIGESEFSVEELGAAVGLSRSHLYKKLMFITGKGPAEFIRTIRLKRGRQLLEKSQLQIAEIAYEVGFNSPKRFTINFKHEFGVSPSEYLRGFK